MKGAETIYKYGKNEVTMHYDQDKIRNEINSSVSIINRGVWSDKTPKVSQLEEHWCYSMITIHHAGDGFIDAPKELEEKHMGEKCWYCSTNGCPDVGYHYFINKKGKIYEGRKIGYKGSHVAGNNSYKIGINFLGDYNDTIIPFDYDDIEKEQITSCVNLINELKKYFPLKELGGHNDYALKKGGSCPGNILYPELKNLRTKTGLSSPESKHKVSARIGYKKCD